MLIHGQETMDVARSNLVDALSVYVSLCVTSRIISLISLGYTLPEAVEDTSVTISGNLKTVVSDMIDTGVASIISNCGYKK